jgi:dihydropteroate synthase
MWQCAGYSFDANAPIVMGILNVTPDSFSDGGRYDNPELACAHARIMLEQGATIIDVGGESTRPGSDEVSVEEELARVLPVVTQLAEEGVAVSVDTRHALVAEACVKAGAAIINDVSGFRDEAMVAMAAACDAGIVVMHMLGEPKNMQVDPHYEDVVGEVSAYLLGQAHLLEAAGVAPARICIDPGPGFGKTYDHNLALLRQTRALASLGYPLMAAYSRKGFIGALTGVEIAAQRVAGSVAVAVFAALHGACVLRVHDVAPTVEALKVVETVKAAECGGEVWRGY